MKGLGWKTARAESKMLPEDGTENSIWKMDGHRGENRRWMVSNKARVIKKISKMTQGYGVSPRRTVSPQTLSGEACGSFVAAYAMSVREWITSSLVQSRGRLRWSAFCHPSQTAFKMRLRCKTIHTIFISIMKEKAVSSTYSQRQGCGFEQWVADNFGPEYVTSRSASSKHFKVTTRVSARL